MNIETSDLKILICDDSITNVLILKKLLESEGYVHVESFTDPTKILPAMLES